MVALTREERRALRSTLLDRAPWLGDTDRGPQSVSAGECDLCGQEARLVQPCGPPPSALGAAAAPTWALGRRCAAELGVAGWCDGHAEEARTTLAWLAALPANADLVARLWWVACGEVRPDPTLSRTAVALIAADTVGNAGPPGADEALP
ncbi:hypothetical protein [Euzebya tangerina]|uniref:hypothetical protein n=1 Tax=Euzebya tangerina TaxID=591198 RepID=UPI000E313DC4|nr:hypothetical protein [Euzebya tangerina]